MPGPITAKARADLQGRVSTGTLNLATGNVEQRACDATDVAGMLEPVLIALGEIEDQLDALREGR